MLTNSLSTIQTPSEFTNWGKTIISHSRVGVKLTTVDEAIAIMKEFETPAPVRTMGSNHFFN